MWKIDLWHIEMYETFMGSFSKLFVSGHLNPKPLKHCIANEIIKMSHILQIDKPEDCGCASEKSTLPHQTEVSNGLCSGTILFKRPIFENYKYIIIIITIMMIVIKYL